MLTAQEIAQRLGKPHREGNEWRCLCPAHNDHSPSFAITERNGRLYFCCRAGCEQERVMAALESLGLWGKTESDKLTITDTYDYGDERSAFLFQVCRIEPGYNGKSKSFIQRHRDTAGNWINNMKGVRRVPYHLNLVVDAVANATPIVIAEGEKDCDNLLGRWGIVATTCPMGAKKWDRDYNQYFKGADVIIIPDNDDVGQEHAAEVAQHLLPVARSVKILHLDGLPEHGDISDWIAQGGTQGELEDLIDATPELVEVTPPTTSNGAHDVRTIDDSYNRPRPRKWLLGTYFCRGFLSGLTGAGATGKTAIRITQLLALCMDRGDIVGVDPKAVHPTKVLMVCLEDDIEEFSRRLEAACIHHGIPISDLKDRFFFWTPKDLRFIEDINGTAQPGGLVDALKQVIRERDIGLVCVDPFVKSHSANENDNQAIDLVASLFLEVGHECGCAVDYVHHHKKGITLAGDQDASRGASSLVNASRVVRTATKMTQEEAEKLGVSDYDRQFLVRVEDAKVNMAPPSKKTVWFKLVTVKLDNPDDEYGSGDTAQAVERWYPPSTQLLKHHMAAVFDTIRKGPEDGEQYSADPRSQDWLVPEIMNITGWAETRAERLLSDWIKNKVVIEDKYSSPKRNRNRVNGLTLNEGKAAQMATVPQRHDDD